MTNAAIRTLAVRGQNPPGIRAAMHPRWPLRLACPRCKVHITLCHGHYTFRHSRAALCVAPRANSAAIPLSSRLAGPAPRRSRCSRGFIHGLLALGIALGVAATVADPAGGMQERRDQRETVADLRSGRAARVATALAEMDAMRREEWGTELRGALLEAYVRAIEEERAGSDPHANVYPMSNLMLEIAALGDVRAAPVLARYGGFGPQPLDLLVSFGDSGLQAVLEVARETQPFGNGTDLAPQRVMAALHLFLYEEGAGAFDAMPSRLQCSTAKM